MTKPDELNWHIVYTYPNAERKIKKILGIHGINVYLPLRKVIRQWSDRVKKLEVPLFPNYIFVKISNLQCWKVLEIPGVVKFLTNEGTPSIISNKEIDTIKIIEEANFQVDTEEDSIKMGSRVVVTHGVLSGLEGLLIDKRGKSTFLLNLENFGKTISLTISSDIIVKAIS